MIDPFDVHTINSSIENLNNNKLKYKKTLEPKIEINKNKDHETSGCNCKNTKCLKLYCECLRKGKTCNECNCIDCENHE